MTGQQLRNSILQEAIHGRLVPNALQPGEHTARELLDDILAARQKAENEAKGKKAKKLTLSKIEEEPWELPEGWCWCTLGDLADRQVGKTPERHNAAYWADGKQPWISISDMQDYGRVNATKERVSALAEKEVFAKRISKKGALIMSFKLTVGRTCILDIDAYHNEAIVTFLIPDELADLKMYLFWLLPIFTNASDSKDAVKGKTLNKESINATLIPLPPLSIQHSIVSKIEALLPLVEAYDAAQGELKALNESLPDKLRKSVLQEAIHGRLVPNTLQPGELTARELLNDILAARQKTENETKGKKAKKLTLSKIEEEPWELPEGWCWCRLGDVAEIERGGNFIKSDFVEKGHPCIHYGQIHMKFGPRTTQALTFLTEEKAAKQRKAHYGDIVMAVTSENIEDVCKCTAWLGKEDVAIGAHTAIFRHYIDCMYLVYYTQSAIFVDQKKEIGHGSKVIEVTPVKMNDFLLPLPPLSIQHSIVSKIEEIFKLLEK